MIGLILRPTNSDPGLGVMSNAPKIVSCLTSPLFVCRRRNNCAHNIRVTVIKRRAKFFFIFRKSILHARNGRVIAIARSKKAQVRAIRRSKTVRSDLNRVIFAVHHDDAFQLLMRRNREHDDETTKDSILGPAQTSLSIRYRGSTADEFAQRRAVRDD